MAIADEERVLGLEALAAARPFCRLAGESVPSIDTVYRNLCRFDGESLHDLESVAVEQRLFELHRSPKSLRVDVDSSVEPTRAIEDA